MGAPLGRQIKEVQTFNYGNNPAYYVVYLNPAGMVFVPADDLVEPIIGFLPEGLYDPSPTNPLGALVSTAAGWTRWSIPLTAGAKNSWTPFTRCS